MCFPVWSSYGTAIDVVKWVKIAELGDWQSDMSGCAVATSDASYAFRRWQLRSRPRRMLAPSMIAALEPPTPGLWQPTLSLRLIWPIAARCRTAPAARVQPYKNACAPRIAFAARPPGTASVPMKPMTSATAEPRTSRTTAPCTSHREVNIDISLTCVLTSASISTEQLAVSLRSHSLRFL